MTAGFKDPSLRSGTNHGLSALARALSEWSVENSSRGGGCDGRAKAEGAIVKLKQDPDAPRAGSAPRSATALSRCGSWIRTDRTEPLSVSRSI